jgi:hypothetical protein
MASNIAKTFSAPKASMEVDTANNDALTQMLDSKSDTNDLSKLDGKDWTDVKHSE